MVECGIGFEGTVTDWCHVTIHILMGILPPSLSPLPLSYSMNRDEVGIRNQLFPFVFY